LEAEGVDGAVRALSQFLVTELTVGETLHRIATLARDSIAPARACGLTLLNDRVETVTSVYTDDLSPDVDEAQYREGDGPCLTAFRSGAVVRVEDTAAAVDRWPAFSRAAVELGVGSTLSFPLHAGGERFGALNLYAAPRGAFTERHELDGSFFSTQAAIVLANVRAYWGAVDLASGLQQAMLSRADIEQAKGKIMAAEGCSSDAAFQILVHASQRENVKVRVLARRVLEGRPPDAPDAG
jgi:GAF domain-containing protein